MSLCDNNAYADPLNIINTLGLKVPFSLKSPMDTHYSENYMGNLNKKISDAGWKYYYCGNKTADLAVYTSCINNPEQY
ncbi:MAG: hypothetical protein K0R49_635 [Burkholderiales bacterium]|nr:hypothetical protein [Burkholderiales bacterium]